MTKNDIKIDDILQTTGLVKQSKYNGGNPLTGEGFNKTSLFILPMIQLNSKERPLSVYFKNAFVDDLLLEHDLENCVFVLLSVKELYDTKWNNLTYLLENNPNYVLDYFVGKEQENSLFMYVFKIPERFVDDYKLITSSKYSKTSEQYKKLFPPHVYTTSGVRKESNVFGILTKSDYLKDKIVKEFINPSTSSPEEVIQLRREIDSWNEVWDFFNIIEETFSNQNYE